VPVRPRHLAAGFGAYVAIVVWFAWSTAEPTTVPWYGPDVSLWTYGATLVGSLALAGGLVAAAAYLRRGGVDEDRLRRGLAATRQKLLALDARAEAAGDDDVETLLASIDEDPPETPVAWAAIEAVLTDLREMLAPPAGNSPGHRDGTVLRRRFTLGPLAGPLAACTILAAISGMMLTGSGYFLQQNFRLNTALVLSLAFVWGGLLAYMAGSALLALRGNARAAP